MAESQTDKQESNTARNIQLHKAGFAQAQRLIRGKKVDQETPWEWKAKDGNKILGKPPNWKRFGLWHLGTDPDRRSDTKDGYLFPYGKGGKVYRSAVRWIRARSAQQKYHDVFNAAGVLMEQLNALRAKQGKAIPVVDITKADQTPDEYLDELAQAMGMVEVVNMDAVIEEVEMRGDDLEKAKGVGLHRPGFDQAKALIAGGKVDKTSPWSFAAADANKILGDPPNWKRFGTWHLGRNTATKPDVKDGWRYPYGKGGKVYRSALRAIRTRAAQEKADDIFKAAGTLMFMLNRAQKAAGFEIPSEDVVKRGEYFEDEVTPAVTKGVIGEAMRDLTG